MIDARRFFARARKFFAKAEKFLISVEKIPGKFDVFCLRPSLRQPRFDVNASLHVETCSMHDRLAFDLDVHNRDHVKLFELLTSFRHKLPSIRRILLNLVDDHVKHLSEHVKLKRDHVIL